jgi:hypothetical protein
MQHMHGMDMSTHQMMMPGMLTQEQMGALKKAKGQEFDHLFLTGMIQHHNGALNMVKDLFEHCRLRTRCRGLQFRNRRRQRPTCRDQNHAKKCWENNPKRKTMKRVNVNALRLLLAPLALCSCFAANTLAQTPAPSPSQEASQAPDKTPPKQQENNPFAPEAAPALPPGMTGADVNDPRFKLTPGMYDAGEAAVGIKHILLVKKPDAFNSALKMPIARR